MAYTTTSALAATGTEIITEALEILGVLEEGEAPNADQTTSALRSLNFLIKLWGADNQIWAQEEYRLNLEAGTSEYTLDVNNVGYTPQSVISANRITAAYYDSPNYTLTYDNLLVSTYSAGEVVTFSGGATGIVATDNGATSMTIRITDGDPVPVNDETMAGANGATSDVNGAPVVLAQAGNSDEATINLLTQEEWYALSDKRTTGTVVNLYQQRLQADNGLKVHVWPSPANTTYDLKLWLQMQYRDVTAGADNIWCTQEWFLPFSYGLAVILSGKYGVNEREKVNLKELADDFRWEAETFQTDGDVSLQPDVPY